MLPSGGEQRYPFGQSIPTADPFGQNFPKGQSIATADPLGHNFPKGHSIPTADPAGQNCPKGHDTHASEDQALFLVSNVPPGHGVRFFCPSVGPQ